MTHHVRQRRNALPSTGVVTAMATWGFIGSGNIGSTVARLAVAAGHDVVLSNSRGAQTLAHLAPSSGGAPVPPPRERPRGQAMSSS